MIKALRLLFAVLFVPFFVSLVFIYELSVYDRSRELPADAQKIGGYYNIGGKIYLRSWNLAPYELEGGADAASFRALDTGRYSYTNVGMDASSVFCGARKMSQPVFIAQDVEYENGAAFYMYCLAAVLLLGAWIYSYLRKRSLRSG